MVKLIGKIAFCFLIISVKCFGQSIAGRVTDSVNNAIPFVNISIRQEGKIIEYVISDENGKFQFVDQKVFHTIPSYLVITTIGYQETNIKIGETGKAYDVILKPSLTQLQGITIRDHSPRVKQNGDTLKYKVSSFTNPQDRVIGDIIKKLPGIDVSADGKISYNGKAISNFYIDGDNLLDDKYNIASNSIPHGVVDEVQILENNQPIKMLRAKVVSNQVAINLKIKDNAKINVIGQEIIGAGLPSKYYADLNAMMFKKKYKAINYLQANNVGDDLQTEIISHNLSAYLETLNNPKPNAILSLGTSKTPDLTLNRYLFNNSQIGNFNDLYNLKNETQIKANVYYLHDPQEQTYKNLTKTYFPGDTITYEEQEKNGLSANQLHSQLTLLKNTDKIYLKDQLLFDLKVDNKTSEGQINGTSLQQDLKTQSYDLSNELNIMQVFGKNNIIEVYSYINSYREPEDLKINPGVAPGLFNNNIPYQVTRQRVSIPTFSQNLYGSFKNTTGSLTQSYKAGYFYQLQNLNSNLNIQPFNDAERSVDSGVNRISWYNQLAYLESGFDYIDGRFKGSITVPVNFQRIEVNIPETGMPYLNHKFFATPRLYFKYDVTLENYIALSYSYKRTFGTIDNVYGDYILTNYRNLQSYGSELSEKKINNASLSYNFKRTLDLLFFTLSVDYNKTDANTIAYSVINKDFDKTIILPFENNTDSYSGSFRFSKYIFGLHSTFSAGFSWQINESNQFLNGVMTPYKTSSPNTYLSLDSKLLSSLFFNYKFDYTHYQSRGKNGANEILLNKIQQTATLNYNPGSSVLINLTDEFRHTDQTGFENFNYNFLDASVKYKMRYSKIDIEVVCRNVFNIKTYDSFSVNSNIFSQSSYLLPGRFMLLKVYFNI